MLVNICLPAWPIDIIHMVMDYVKSQGIYLIFPKSVFLLRPNNAGNDVTIEELPSLLNTFMSAAAIRIKDVMYLVGGADERSQSMDCYDIRTRTWSIAPSMRVAQRRHVIVPLEPHSFVVSGRKSSCEIYNTETKEWSSTKDWPEFSTRFCSLSSVAFQNNLYVFESGEYEILRCFLTSININIHVKI